MISWLHLRLTNRSWHQKSLIMRFRLLISWSNSQYSNQNCKILLKFSISWKKWLSILWLFFWSSEKNHFRSNEIWSHDHFPQKLINSANWNCLKSFLRKTDSFPKKLKVQENKVIKSLIFFFYFDFIFWIKNVSLA